MARKNHSTLKSSWDLDGLTNEQRQSIDPALKAYLWTPIPIGMVVTAYLAELMRFLSGKSTQQQTDPTALLEDNTACIYTAANYNKPMAPRSKHVDTWIFKLREFVAERVLTLVKIESH
jgi:hypothetical protein